MYCYVAYYHQLNSNMIRLSTKTYFFLASVTTFVFLCSFLRLKDEDHLPIKLLPNQLNNSSNYNIWLIFTHVGVNSPLQYKFSSIITNLMRISSVKLHFHIIVDDDSRKLALDELKHVSNATKLNISFNFYNVTDVVLHIEDIVNVMKPHFSSKPGTYYSGALFYISLGLYRFAPADQDYAVLLDCDLYFKEDVALLFQEFLTFKPTALFGLAPELSPVYRHILHKYKNKYKSTFGEFYNGIRDDSQSHPLGFQGYNSGVVLLKIKEIRKSKLYPLLLTNSSVTNLTEKYSFRGHLGDQDFYTLMGYEYPQLIETLNCGYNRQLCTWWRDHGYGDMFHNYSKCDHKIVILHGNCNTKLPVD